ncbi:uncoordinated protein 83, partial [Loa loa]
MKLDESTCSTTTITTTTTAISTTITNDSCTITHHHSDDENSWNDNMNNLQEMNSHLTWLSPTDIDEQRQRIHYSPVKSFYKTVPLDETGATDTEVPRISVSGWPAENMGYSTDMHVLTDSLIVNTEEEPEMDSNNDIKEILSMLNDDENGNPKWEGFEQQGTQWREFKYGKTRYQLSFKRNWLLSYSDNNDKHSCDASSEESDDLPTDLNPITEVKSTTTSSVLDTRLSSLKRRRKGRLSTSDRFPSIVKITNDVLGQQDMENSMCSETWSEIPHLDGATASLGSIRLPSAHYLGNAFRSKHQMRRKLRARRLPRSMSDGEHLGICMDASIHSAPGASISHWSGNICRDSDTTGPDQSDVPPYEWDDYKPPAKAEDEWDDVSDREDISVLTIEDDFHMQLDSSHSSFPSHLFFSSNHSSHNFDEKKTMIREKAPRPVATVTGKCIRKDSVASFNDKLELIKARTIPLTTCKLLNSSKLRHFSESELHNILLGNSDNTNNRTECSIESFPLSSLPKQSPLPTILSKIEKFASSLKLIHHDDNEPDSSFSTLSSIRSLDDVDIHERLLEEQEELQTLLSSDSFSGDLSGLLGEFEPLCRGYEEALERVEQLMAQIEAIRDKWNDWSETQRIVQMMMRTIESHLSDLRKGTDNSEQICSELELCQERMNRLETACNYLSCNLASLHNRPSTQPPPIDFASELALYSNALIQLKTRFEKELGHAKSVDKSTLVRSRKRAHLKDDEKMMMRLEKDNCASANHINWSIKVLFIIAVIAAFTAWFATSSLVPWRTTLGPHLDYIDGPPPL